MIVVACNTATAAAVPLLRRNMTLPIVGMEPAVKPATAATRSGTVGVLATVGTLQSARFAALLDQFGASIQVLTRACPGSWSRSRPPISTGRAREYARGPWTGLIDAAPDCGWRGGRAARGAAGRVDAARSLQDDGGVAFWTSGDPAVLAGPLSRLWGAPVRCAAREYAGRGA
jgi:glutamate racemase